MFWLCLQLRSHRALKSSNFFYCLESAWDWDMKFRMMSRISSIFLAICSGAFILVTNDLAWSPSWPENLSFALSNMTSKPFNMAFNFPPCSCAKTGMIWLSTFASSFCYFWIFELSNTTRGLIWAGGLRGLRRNEPKESTTLISPNRYCLK